MERKEIPLSESVFEIQQSDSFIRESNRFTNLCKAVLEKLKR
jgi:hypothetical protein